MGCSQDTVNKLIKDGVSVLTFNYLTLALNFAFATLLIRLGEGASYGQYIYLSNFQSMAGIILGFGLNIGLVRFEGSEVKFRQMGGIFTLSTLILLGIAWWISDLWHGLGATPLSIGLVATGVTAVALLQPLWQWHNHLDRYWRWTFVQSLLRVAAIVAMSWWLSVRTEGLWTSIAVATWAILLFMLLFKAPLSFNIWPLKPALTELVNHSSSWLWLSQLAVTLYGRLGLLLLPTFGFAAADITSYGYIFSIFAAVIMIPALLQNILMRPLFQQKLEGQQLLHRMFSKLALTGLVVSWLFMYGLNPVLSFLTKHQNPEWTDMIWGFAPGVSILFLANPLGLALLTAKHDRIRTGIQWITAGFYTLTLIFLLPRLGLKGAAISASLSYGFLYLGFYFSAWRLHLWNLRSKVGHVLIHFVLSFFPWLFWFNIF